MKVTIDNVGENVYFIDRNIGENVFVIEYGSLTGVIPKYNFLDKFAQSYSRCANIMILVKNIDGSTTSKVVNDEGLVFAKIQDVLDYCSDTSIVFGYSVLQSAIQKGELA